MVVRRVEAMYREYMSYPKPQVTANELAKEILRYAKFAGIPVGEVHQHLRAKARQSHH